MKSSALDETDFQIMLALCLGMSQEMAGKFVITGEHPVGVSDRTVRTRVAANQDVYDRCIARGSEAFRRDKADFELLTKQQYREKLEKLRDKAARVKETVLDQALANPSAVDFLGLGARVAESIEDRDFGKAKQVVANEVSGRVDFVWTSHTRAELLEQEHDMLRSQNMLLSAPADAIEAEVVADA